MSECALLRCDGCGVRRRVDFTTDGMGRLIEEAAPCKCTPAVVRAEPMNRMSKPTGRPRGRPRKVTDEADSPNGNGVAPVNRIAAFVVPEPAPLVAVEKPAAPSPLVEEVRSLRATYEADPFLRVEEEDGEWRLRVNLPFETQAEAFRAAAALMGTFSA